MRTVIVLAGGTGQRFRESSKDIPKPLIKVHARSQLFWACKGAHLSYKPNQFIFATRSGLMEKISEELMSFEFLDEFEVVKFELRLCADMKILSLKKHAELSVLIDGIGKQITAWRNSQTV
jgi:hypothetical protein